MKLESENHIKNKFDLLMWWGIVALMGLLIFSTAAEQTILIILILLGSFRIIKEKNWSFIKQPIVLPLIIFMIVRVISIIFSNFPQLSISALNKEIFFYLIFFIFLFELSKYSKQEIHLLIKILIIAAFIASIVGTSMVLLGISHRAKSTTSGYATLGLFLSATFACVFALGKNKNFFPSRIGWLITLLVIATGILFTLNRSNWFSLSIIILIIGLYREKLILSVLIIFFLSVILLVPGIYGRYDQMIHFSQNLSDRDILWKGAVMIWDKHPILGFGPRTFNEIFLLRDQIVDKGVGGWHNEYLQIYVESGILGLVTFLWLSFSIFYRGIKKLVKFKKENQNFELMLAILTSIATLYLNTLTGGFIFDPIIKVLFFFLLAIEIIIIGSKRSTEEERMNIPNFEL